MEQVSLELVQKNWKLVLLAFIISLVISTFIIDQYVRLVRYFFGIDQPSDQKKNPRVPNWLNGLIERLFFTIIVALNLSGIATAMIGWIGIKIASNWQQKKDDEPDDKRKLRLSIAFTSLQASILSMLFAIIGGTILRYAIFSGNG